MVVPRTVAELDVTRTEEEGRLRLALAGELDLYTAPQLDDALVGIEGEQWPVFVIDLTGLRFIDSVGLRLLVRTQARALRDRRRMLLVPGPETVDRVFRLTGLVHEFEWIGREAPVPAGDDDPPAAA
jgi:anti-sigma B factor antagonist